jgi:hypothetical protein
MREAHTLGLNSLQVTDQGLAPATTIESVHRLERDLLTVLSGPLLDGCERILRPAEFVFGGPTAARRAIPRRPAHTWTPSERGAALPARRHTRRPQFLHLPILFEICRRENEAGDTLVGGNAFTSVTRPRGIGLVIAISLAYVFGGGLALIAPASGLDRAPDAAGAAPGHGVVGVVAASEPAGVVGHAPPPPTGRDLAACRSRCRTRLTRPALNRPPGTTPRHASRSCGASRCCSFISSCLSFQYRGVSRLAL